MACGGYQKLDWSDRTYRIRDIIRNPEFTLPVLVKVEEGIYGFEESESFSQDDLLKLDLVKSILKVVACCVDHLGLDKSSGVIREDEYGYVEKTEDLTIPLRYRGVVKIFHPEAGRKVYHSVSEMVKVFPRYVKTIDSFVSKNDIRVDRKSVIELDKIIPGQGLLCNILKDELDDDYSNRTQILLDISIPQKFLLLPDNNDYTLEQIIKTFQLPQYVTFEKANGPKLVTTNIQEAIEQTNIFEGTVKIKRKVEMETVIGHYKPPEGTSTVTQSQCRRTLVIIPMDSYTARNIEVRVPLNPDDDNDYQMVIAKNFTKKDTEEENIDGTIYVDFLKTPKATLVEYEEIDVPPPRPPRPRTGQAVTEDRPQDKPPPRPPKPPKRVSLERGAASPYQGNPPLTPKPGPRSHRIPSPPDQESYDYVDIKDKKQPTGSTGTPSLAPKPGPRSPRVPSPPDSEIEDYEEIVDTHIPTRLTDDDKHKGYVGIQTKEALLEKVPEKHRFSLRSVHKELFKFFKKQKSSEPCEQPAEQANITRNPSVSNQDCDLSADQVQSKTDSRKWFESLQPNELYSYLTKLKLDKMAIACRDEELNGSFFNSITDKQLEVDFRLSALQRMKFRSFQNEGWMPS